MRSISVIVNTYNQILQLDLVLTYLAKQCKHSAYTAQIVIADDGSTQSTSEIIKKHQDDNPEVDIVHVWHEDSGFRRSAILNKAVARASGEYLIFLDGDCVVFNNFLASHVQLMERGYFVAGRRVLLSSKITSRIFSNPQYITYILNGKLVNYIAMYIQGMVNKVIPNITNQVILNILQLIRYYYWHTTKWKLPKGCNFGVFKNDFVAVNGFDESFVGWGHEDSDLFIRLLHHGVKIKDGKIMACVLHLWHPEASRCNATQNMHRLQACLNDVRIVKAKLGIDQYL